MDFEDVNYLISKILKRKSEFEIAHFLEPNFVMVNSKTLVKIIHHTLANMPDQSMYNCYKAGEIITMFKRNNLLFLKNDRYPDGDFQIGYIE